MLVRRISRFTQWRGKGRRDFSTGHLYVHRTVPELDRGSSTAITLGLFSSLKALRPDAGYFRPIDATGERSDLVRARFRLEDEVRSMRGTDQKQAYDLLVSNNLDELLEQIFIAYEKYKRRHDFVVIEGTHLDNLWSDSGSLNASIASALGAPVMLAIDANVVLQSCGNDSDSNWPTKVAKHSRLTALAFEKLAVGIIGAFVHNAPQADDGAVLKNAFSQWKIPLAACIPLAAVTSSVLQADRATTALFGEFIDTGVLERAISQEDHVHNSPLLFRNSIFMKASEKKQVILLPEGDEPRTVEAAGFLLKHEICNLILLGNRQTILAAANKCNVDLSSAVIRDPGDPQEIDKYANVYYQARAHKGVTLDQAREWLRTDPITLGTCMVSAGDADGMVSGAIHTTANTVRPALQIIKTEHGTPIVSSVFFICLRNKVVVYADVAINTSPSAEDLATIAISSADTASDFGIQPRVALLSYATGDSNAGPLVQKVADAAALAKSKRPDLFIEGPFQYDAAVNPVAAHIKLKGKASAVAGKANIFIFPDLNSSNIACKAVQQHTGAVAIGPILQGLRKPINDLSRGCTVKDIIATVATTAVQASQKAKRIEEEKLSSQ